MGRQEEGAGRQEEGAGLTGEGQAGLAAHHRPEGVGSQALVGPAVPLPTQPADPKVSSGEAEVQPGTEDDLRAVQLPPGKPHREKIINTRHEGTGRLFAVKS